MSAIAAFLAVFREYRLSPGEVPTIAVVAEDRRQARILFRYIEALFRPPALAQLVAARTAESLELTNGVVVEITTNSARTTRGYSFAAVLGDEACHWRTDTAADADSEVLTAVRPGLVKVPGSLLVLLSSPHARRGVMYAAWQRSYGQDDARTLVWVADTLAMNPTADQESIAAAYVDDPVSAATEYGAGWRLDLEAFVAREAVAACTVPDRHEIPPLTGNKCVSFTDPSGGSADSWTLAIAHGEKRGAQWVAVLDLLREVRPPFSPERVVADFAALLKQYRITTVVGDRYGGEFPRELFAKHGVHYEPSERSKSDVYIETLPLLNAHRVELLDVPRLATQLLGLERRTSRGARDTVDHAPRAHDDLANAACGALLLASNGPSDAMPMVSGAGSVMRAFHGERGAAVVPGIGASISGGVLGPLDAEALETARTMMREDGLSDAEIDAQVLVLQGGGIR